MEKDCVKNLDFSKDKRFSKAPKDTIEFISSIIEESIDCLLCDIKVSSSNETFNCYVCFSIFHLNCVNFEISKTKKKKEFTCPKCYTLLKFQENPYYNCFCKNFYDNKSNKEFNPNLIPHGCGVVCNKVICKHLKCSIPCHPGNHQICTEKECEEAAIKNKYYEFVKTKNKTTKCINLKGKKDLVGVSCEYDRDIIYCGRAQNQGGWHLSKSIWANPFPVTDKDDNKAVCLKYEEYIKKTPDLKLKLEGLIGKKLACWCLPYPCHTQVLMKLMKEYNLI